MQRILFSTLTCALLLSSASAVHAQERNNEDRAERSFLERLIPFFEERREERERARAEQAAELPADETPAPEPPPVEPGPATTTPGEPLPAPFEPAPQPPILQPAPEGSLILATSAAPIGSGAAINPQSGGTAGLYESQAQARDRSALLLLLSAGLLAGGLLLARRPRGPREPVGAPAPRHA